jgi:glycogen debranching enzyme
VGLASLRAPGRGVYASGGPLYRSAVFGRDALQVAEDLLPRNVALAREIVIKLAELQGEGNHAVTEEEPGRIPHEYRRSSWDGDRVSRESTETLRELGEKWGGTDDELLYYGSADATPLFVQVVARICEFDGPAVLGQRVRRRSGETATIGDAVADACRWICRRIESSSIGLLEFESSNPRGLAIQTWKDSATGVTHPDGTPANTNAPIATLDLQALAFDALQAATQLLPSHAGRPSWEGHVRRLVRQVPRLFWLEDERFFAQAIDRDPAGLPRLVKTRGSEVGALMASGLLDGVSAPLRREMQSAIAAALLGPEFLTDAGIRCRSLRHVAAVDFADYHGSWACWPKDTQPPPGAWHVRDSMRSRLPWRTACSALLPGRASITSCSSSSPRRSTCSCRAMGAAARSSPSPGPGPSSATC